jgi:SAM-dependent methyltransferase
VETRTLNCPVCMGAKLEAFSAVPHDVPGFRPLLSLRACQACGLAWQYPRHRSTAESVQLLLETYGAPREGSYFNPRRRREVVKIEFAFLNGLFDKPGALLDVGAGDGTFIAHAASHGWQCIGVDPAAHLDPTLTAGGAANFKLIQGSLDTLNASQRFDAVTMWDVIEHLDEPESLIRTASRFLKDDGVFVVETGNFESADRILGGPDWWAYAADHRWYFGPSSLSLILKRAGFAHIAIAGRVLRPGWHGSAGYTGPSYGRTLKKIVRSPWSARNTLAQHRRLSSAAAQWPRWAGLGIFCIVASQRPIAAGENGLPLITIA